MIVHFLNFNGQYKPITLTPINGEVELSINGTSSRNAISLIDQLLSTEESCPYNPGEAKLIPISQRDQILVNLYNDLFGNQVQSTLVCEHCREKYDINFGIREFSNSVLNVDDSLEFTREENNFYSLPTGVKLRLPNGEDELEAGHSSKKNDFLFGRIVANPKDRTKENQEAVELVLSQVAPLIKSSFSTKCPECNKTQIAHFDIQSYFLQMLINNKSRVLYEIHLLARNYNWTYREIISIPRKQREQYVKFINKEN